MDELTLLRELAGDPPGPAPAARAAARDRLRREMAVTERRSGRRRRLAELSVAAAAAVAAAALVGTAVERDGTVRGGGAHPIASAAPVLHLAAERARREPALTWRDDQFLYTRTVLTEVPVDGRGRPRTWTNEYWRSAGGSQPSRVVERGRSWTEAPFDPETVWPPRRHAAIAALPTEPGALIEAVVDWFGGRSSIPGVDDETAYLGLTMLLDDLLPPDLRAAAFEALARIPGVEVVDGEVDARGRRGIGITRASDPREAGRVIVLDRETHEFLGMRDRNTWEDGTRVRQLITLEEHGVVDRAGERP